MQTAKVTKLATGKGMEILRFDYGRDDSNEAHCHPFEQTGYVQSGKFRFWVEGIGVRDVVAGDAYIVPADAEHTFEVLEPGVVIVTTSPEQSTYVRGQKK